jgi:hypothetical protein
MNFRQMKTQRRPRQQRAREDSLGDGREERRATGVPPSQARQDQAESQVADAVQGNLPAASRQRTPPIAGPGGNPGRRVVVVLNPEWADVRRGPGRWPWRREQQGIRGHKRNEPRVNRPIGGEANHGKVSIMVHRRLCETPHGIHGASDLSRVSLVKEGSESTQFAPTGATNAFAIRLQEPDSRGPLPVMTGPAKSSTIVAFFAIVFYICLEFSPATTCAFERPMQQRARPCDEPTRW